MPRPSPRELVIASGMRPWEPAEDEAVRARYLAGGAAALAADLGRTRTAIFRRANKLGLISRPRWTEADNKRIRLLWGELSLTGVAKALGRPVKGVYKHAQDIGLPLGCPQGHEYLTDAAERTGFARETLKMILRWARVDVRTAMSRPLDRRPGYRTHVIDSAAVDEAVEGWLRTETINAAAGRHGMSAEKLRRIVEASGLDLPRKPANKKHWRIPSEVIDAAVEANGTRENIRAAATRLGVPRGTLRHWAVRAGVPRPPGKLWMVDRIAIEKLVQEKRAA